MNNRDYLSWPSASTSQGSHRQRTWHRQPQNQRTWQRHPENQRAWQRQPQNQRAWHRQPENQRAWEQQPQNQRAWQRQPQNHRLDSRTHNQDQTTSSRSQNTAWTRQTMGESSRPQTPAARSQAPEDEPSQSKELLLARTNLKDYPRNFPGSHVIKENIMRLKFQCPECRKTYVSQKSMYKHYLSMHGNRDPDENLAQIGNSPINIIGNHIVRNDYTNDRRLNYFKSNIDNVSEVEDYFECDECECYFTDEKKFHDHTIMHGSEVLCKNCNGYFCFEDFRDHVKDCRPEKKKESAKKKTPKCNDKSVSKIEALKHIYRKEFKHRSTQTGSHDDVNENVEDVLTEKDILYICEACDIATASYDVAVQHSQKHVVGDEQFNVVNCDTCQLKFEPVCYENHSVEHYRKKYVTNNSFKYLKYKYHSLLTNEWLNFFDMEKDAVDEIVSGSIYAATRGVRMQVVEGNLSFTNTLYRCRQCDNFIEASTVLHHAQNFDTCMSIQRSFLCTVCYRSFETRTACNNHEATHTGNEIFRIVIFNADNDREFNYKLNNKIIT